MPPGPESPGQPTCRKGSGSLEELPWAVGGIWLSQPGSGPGLPPSSCCPGPLSSGPSQCPHLSSTRVPFHHREPALSHRAAGLLKEGTLPAALTCHNQHHPPATESGLGGLGPGPSRDCVPWAAWGAARSAGSWHKADGTWATATQPPCPALHERSLQVPSSRGNCWINTLPHCWWWWQALAGRQAVPSCFSTAKRAPAGPGSAAS